MIKPPSAAKASDSIYKLHEKSLCMMCSQDGNSHNAGIHDLHTEGSRTAFNEQAQDVQMRHPRRHLMMPPGRCRCSGQPPSARTPGLSQDDRAVTA